MHEFGFEVSLAAFLESEADALVSRQIGCHVHGRRIMDLVCIEPGPEFDQRTTVTPETIPPLAVESAVGPGRMRYWKDAFDCQPDRARDVVDRAVACGFFERERRNGRTYVRQTIRYPDWFDRIVGIENKPDLGRPGGLSSQLLTDVSLGLVDEVILATASHVTGAHRNRIPDEVGIWRFEPDAGTREVIREATQLPTDRAGIEILERGSARTAIRVATPEELVRARRRVAERAYGKGWRTYDLPGCVHATADDDGLPVCDWYGRVVRPTTECGTHCDGFEAAEPPAVDFDALRANGCRWQRHPMGRTSRQVGLDSFGAARATDEE